MTTPCPSSCSCGATYSLAADRWFDDPVSAGQAERLLAWFADGDVPDAVMDAACEVMYDQHWPTVRRLLLGALLAHSGLATLRARARGESILALYGAALAGRMDAEISRLAFVEAEAAYAATPEPRCECEADPLHAGCAI